MLRESVMQRRRQETASAFGRAMIVVFSTLRCEMGPNRGLKSTESRYDPSVLCRDQEKKIPGTELIIPCFTPPTID